MDIVTLGAALNGSKKYTDQVTQSLAGSDIGLAGYTKGTVAKQDVSPTDNVNQGLGKIEKRVSDNENNISLKANTADVNTATANLQAQIDQIAQAAGTGSADTEVAQARVGADGTSYQTLKARLDGENSELKKKLTNVNDAVFDTSTNLANTIDVVEKAINASGELIDAPNYHASNFIPIDNTKTYVKYALTHICTYSDDVDEAFIERRAIANDTPFTFDSNVRYIRISSNSKLILWQLNVGEELLPYEPYYEPKSKIKELEEAIKNESTYDHGDLKTSKGDFCEWYSGQHENYTEEGLGRNTTYEEILALYDEFVSDSPSYVTKNSLGTSSDGKTIYEYVFKPIIQSSGGIARKTPKVLIDACIHGFEKNASFGLYYFLFDLLYNWKNNKSLKSVRSSVEIHVIPVLNPYGFDNLTYTNANEININRNFATQNWYYIDKDEDPANATGDEPFDQPESSIVKDWVEDNFDALCYIACHTNGNWVTTGYNNANACMSNFAQFTDKYFQRMALVFNRHIEMQTLIFNTYDGIDTGASAFGSYQLEGMHPGTASQWASESADIIGMTLEGFNALKISSGETVVEYLSPLSMKMNSEILGNMVIQMVHEYSH